MEAKNYTTTNDNSTNIFLTGAILFANLDYTSLGEYALKAAIGGCIWMVFKLTSDYISSKINQRKKNNKKDNHLTIVRKVTSENDNIA